MSHSMSRQSVSALLDLIENKMSMMTVNDRDDLREMIVLKRCLAELNAIGFEASESRVSHGVLAAFAEVPRRGRRRRIINSMAG